MFSGQKNDTRERNCGWHTRTRNSLSAAHSFSVNFCVRAFWGSSSASAAAVDSVGFVLESVSGGMLDMVMRSEE